MEATSSNCDEGLVSSKSEKVSELTKEVRFLRSKTEQQEQEIAKLREKHERSPAVSGTVFQERLCADFQSPI